MPDLLITFWVGMEVQPHDNDEKSLPGLAAEDIAGLTKPKMK